jgi:hypothetical protein
MMRTRFFPGGRQGGWMLAFAFLFLPLPLVAGSVPEEVFPGIALDSPLQDRYGSGEAVVLKGVVADASKAGGQILFRFAHQVSGEEVRIFFNLEGNRFEGYQIFQHSEAGTYDLEVFLGGTGESQLAFIGKFSGLEISSEEGVILLPQDFFSGVVFDENWPTAYRTGDEVTLSGESGDPEMANGQILFNFIPRSGGEEISVYANLEGMRFARRHLFLHEESGMYDLEVFMGGAGAISLGFVGRFQVEIEPGSGVIQIPRAFFPGLTMDSSLPAELPIGRSHIFAGTVDEGIHGISIELESIAGVRQISVGVENSRFFLPLRLREEERGPLELRIFVEMEDGKYRQSGSFEIKGVDPLPSARLTVGVLGVSLLAGEARGIPLANEGEISLDDLEYDIEGPFVVVEAPSALGAGEIGEVLVRYDGGEGQGWLRLWEADGPTLPQKVALSGIERGDFESSFAHRRADGDGHIEMVLDFTQGDHVLVLYSGQMDPSEAGLDYSFKLGGEEPVAKRVVAMGRNGKLGQVDRLKQTLREREQVLAAAFCEHPSPASKPAAVEYRVGDRRDFTFPGIGEVPTQRLSATVVAVEKRAVAWVQDGLRETSENLDLEQIGEVVAQFSREDYDLVVAKFGAPSDVDGDGRLSFLFTHLVDEVGGLAGFYSATSVVPEEVGGDANMTDMMFISPAARFETYRPLLVHEFQHLLNFNQHVLVRRGIPEADWLNEGLSHLSEDLVAGYAVSGQSEIIQAFLEEPSAVGLEGDALLDPAKRGAGYLFVRSLVDGLGEDVLLRLVGTGLADRDNVEAATGEEFEDLLAFWGGQLYTSGLGLNGHSRFNFGSQLLRAGQDRGFPLPAVAEYQVGGAALQGRVKPRGMAFVRVQGKGVQRVEIEADPESRLGIVALTVPRTFVPSVFVPADYVPGMTFSMLVPGAAIVGREYPVRGILEEGVQDLLFRFVGGGKDTVRFEPEIAGREFSQVLQFDRIGDYELQVFTGTGGSRLDYAGGFGPIRVMEEPAATAVGGELGGQPFYFDLDPVFPNPFNASSAIGVAVPEGGGEITLEIFDVLGQRVRVLYRGYLPGGKRIFIWDGLGGGGDPVASGIYLFCLKEGEANQRVQKGLLVR